MSQQLSRTSLRLLLPAAAAACLALSACGSDPGPSMEELESQVAPSTDAAAPVADPSALAELRFDPEKVACSPRITANARGAWETAAPRTDVSESAPLKLRNNNGAGDAPVTATVSAPDGTTYKADGSISGDTWVELAFPGDFEDASLAEGAFTVVWTTDQGAYVACDGFKGA
ncbi:hypothetical protein [Streptomonospora wellingtoniae]|uniref:Uncharacterized protein n=1 Tax=Streptomonospora wellingtoniae TaxID=3075544 RepID=A0ABU2KQR4_9ACTN|nr:hypothetical protein [Streptomonospora sp. DSM 45055]MDT0301522.1 hypothetical protein [Streptomonospora sp. DSM 45055]